MTALERGLLKSAVEKVWDAYDAASPHRLAYLETQTTKDLLRFTEMTVPYDRALCELAALVSKMTQDTRRRA